MGCGLSAQPAGPFHQTAVVHRLQDLVDDTRPANKGRGKKAAGNTVPGPCLLVASRPASTIQKSFEEKPRAGRVLRCPRLGELSYGVGYVCRKGSKPGSSPTVNQDDFFVIQVGDINIFGVFDGHGVHGDRSSGFAAANLPKYFARDPSLRINPRKALGQALSKTHEEYLYQDHLAGIKYHSSLSGTTATLVAFSGKSSVCSGPFLYTAHIGDSRAVLARCTESGSLQAVDLTHHNQQPREQKEAMSRCLCCGRDLLCHDGLAGSIVSSCEPCLMEASLGKDDQFFVLASNGVWEFISSQEAVEIVGRFHASEAKKAAEALAEEARQRWLQRDSETVDDITVLCAWFEPTILA